MTLTCLIVDDEPYAIRLLARHISQFPALQLMHECSYPLEALTYLNSQPVDLIFLDIHMPQLNGLQLASVFPPGQSFIFTTAHSQYAVESYEKNAVDYLLKPVTFERFVKAATRAMAKIEAARYIVGNTATETPIFIKSGKALVQLTLSEVILIESQKDYAIFYTAHLTHATLKTLKELELQLPDDFQRIHYSYLVNIHHVSKVEDNHVYVLQHRIPVSEKYRDNFFSRLHNRLL